MEIISFDDPVNTVPSANLISGEYLSSSIAPTNPSNGVINNRIHLDSVSEHNLFAKVSKEEANAQGSTASPKTTKEPGSIIERIINSITAISTTASPDLTLKFTTPVEAEPTKGSAILKLANKKSTKSDKNSVTDSPQTLRKRTRTPKTSTTEKPTTIIERILSSLSAIQADSETTSSTQVGTDFNQISSPPSTTKTSRATKSTSPRSTSSSEPTTTSLPAQTSTSVSPLSVLEEISSESTLQKGTIGKLLALLNSLTSTAEPESNLVVVTPKLTNYISGTTSENLIDSQITPNTLLTKSLVTAVPTTTTPAPTTKKSTTKTTTQKLTTSVKATTTRVRTKTTTVPPETTTLTTTTPKLFTSPSPISAPDAPAPSLGTRIQETLSSFAKFMSSTFNPVQGTDTTTNIPKTTLPPTTPATTPKPVVTTTTTVTTSTVPSTTTVSTTAKVPDTTTSSPTTTTTLKLTTTSITTTTTKAPLPNPLSLSTTTNTPLTTSEITLPGTTEQRAAVVATTESVSTTSILPETTTDNAFVIPSTLPTLANFEVSPGSVRVFSANDLVDTFDPDDADIFGSTVSIISRTTAEISTQAPFVSPTTTDASTTSLNVDNSSNSSTTTAKTAVEATTQNISSNNIKTTGAITAKPPATLNQTGVDNNNNNNTPPKTNVSPVQNNVQVQSTSVAPTKDYFVFAVLNNNTILRKRPSTFPTKETPFVIVGVYPNNTVVQKFPNGTQVPMEPIIRVNGFDTRANPPPLPEITSNQVTPVPTPGPPSGNKNLQTVLIVNNFWWLVLLQLSSLHTSLEQFSVCSVTNILLMTKNCLCFIPDLVAFTSNTLYFSLSDKFAVDIVVQFNTCLSICNMCRDQISEEYQKPIQVKYKHLVLIKQLSTSQNGASIAYCCLFQYKY